MSESERETVRLPNTSAQFTATHWSVILAAKDGNSPQADDALSRLCRTYWYPLYAYVADGATMLMMLKISRRSFSLVSWRRTI